MDVLNLLIQELPDLNGSLYILAGLAVMAVSIVRLAFVGVRY